MVFETNKKCIICKNEISSYDLHQKSVMKCPRSRDWRKVIDDKLPHAESVEKAKEISHTLNQIGILSNGYHAYCHGNKGGYAVFVEIIEDALERLMKHEPCEGALYHENECICENCVYGMRKKLYDGGNTVPEIKCPICDSILIPLEK